MTRFKNRFRALALCIMALGLMTVGAASAQAEAGNHWSVNGSILSGAATGTLEVEKFENDTASLLTEINKTKVKFLCKSAKLTNVQLVANGAVSEGTVTFHQCVTYLNDVLSPPCEPFSGTDKGLIQSEKAKGLLALHEGKLITVIKPVGVNFGIIRLGEECSIGEEVPVTGQLTLLDGEVSVEKAIHLVKQGPLTSLTALGNPATIDGAALLRLTSGLKFSGLML